MFVIYNRSIYSFSVQLSWAGSSLWRFVSPLYIFTLNTVKVHQELFLVNKVSECQRRLCVNPDDDGGGGGDDVDHDDGVGDNGDDDDEDIVIQSHWDGSASLEIFTSYFQ